jgi:N-acetylmuramoyl-L-alanine amidase CwlA
MNITKGYISSKINGIRVDSSIKCNAGNYLNKLSRDVKYIVCHYTGNKKDNAKNNATYFKNNDVDVSAHFFVDDTSIYQSVKLCAVAWHCGTSLAYYHKLCRNSNSFGVEMCCTAGNYKISDKTLENSAYLVAHLCKMLGITSSEVDTYVLRHYDVTHKKCPAQMVDDKNEWIAFKERVKVILKADEKPKKKKSYSGTFPKLHSRGYFKKGDKGTQVERLQKFLNWFGDYKLDPDGIFGNKTLAAVMDFQKKNNLDIDGLFGKESLKKAKSIKK